MASYFQLVARAVCVGVIIVIVAIVSRQVYLRSTAEADRIAKRRGRCLVMLGFSETMGDDHGACRSVA